MSDKFNTHSSSLKYADTKIITMIDKSLDASLLFSIIDLTSQIRLRGDLIYKFANITTQQYVVLLHLARDPNIPYIENGNFNKGMLASDLADSMKISRPAMTNLLKILIEKDLVEQIGDANDRRRKKLILTPKGEKLIMEMEPLRRKANAAFLSQFSKDEKTLFLKLIERCATYAKDQLENPEELTKMYQRILALKTDSK